MDVANELHETGLFVYAVPDLIGFWPLGPSNALSIIVNESYIYPNPVSETLFIDLDKIRTLNNSFISYNIRLYNRQGSMLHQVRVKGGIIQFNVSNLANGIYYLQIYDEISATSETHKILVRH